ncbi:hypothetical protein NSA39_15835 [Enterococcus gallinarum]|uniref:hypothetical protein n=1 Tax=Enterococcus gallinarum TaxID=1353 RepID=UPI00214C1673|nr:hypothetical protein [Enterococcus gallinarum]MCR1929306.1 hypothetical protein [Enterococcus gallinarum]
MNNEEEKTPLMKEQTEDGIRETATSKSELEIMETNEWATAADELKTVEIESDELEATAIDQEDLYQQSAEEGHSERLIIDSIESAELEIPEAPEAPEEPEEPGEPYDEYYETKESDHQRIESLIEQAENELADLRLRKAIMEADFNELCHHYQTLIIGNQDISIIAKKTLLEYYAYEFLKPLRSIGLMPTDNYDVWKTKHFLVKFQLNEEKAMDLYFKLNPINSQYESQYLPLLTIYSDTREVRVNDHQILYLLRQWYTDKIFTVNQLSLFNYDINLLLTHFRASSFMVSPSLIDNTQELAVDLETEFPITTDILDQIFITTMENQDYDFVKAEYEDYEIFLDKKQRLTIRMADDRTHLFIDSDRRKRSLLDFFTSYEFLVPLVVPSYSH